MAGKTENRGFHFKKVSYLPESVLRPRFLAIVFSTYLLVGHIYPVRQCGYQRKYPYGGDYLRRCPYGHPGLERIDDDKESIDSDRRQCQSGRVHTGTLSVRHNVAEYFTKHPMTCKHKIKKR